MTARVYDSTLVWIYPSRQELGVAAADHAAQIIWEAVEGHGSACIIFATGNSQLDMIDARVGISNEVSAQTDEVYSRRV